MPTNTEISNFFLSKLITSDKYFSAGAVRDTALLFPDFWDKLQSSCLQFNKKYPGVEIVLVETYRSNTRQLMHYNNGASQIKKDGMHHFGIAVDIAFLINGQFTYKGDYQYLRACHTKAGLFLISKGDDGHVQYIPAKKEEQSALRLTVNNSIIKFQKQYNLVSDGIIGSKTIAKAKEVFK